jgi:hypothetical protein
MNPFLIVLLLILTALALPPALKKKSWLWFFMALVLSFVGVVLPLFVFFFSSFMTPEWKGACTHGWLDCFIVGKLALTPFVLVATAAWYRVEILHTAKTTERWVVVGMFLGAIVATVCCVFGLVSIGWQAWMLVPFYVAAWYSIRAAQLIQTASFGFWTYFGALLGSLPFWLLSWFWSRSVFESLPDKVPSDCFVVTAAGRGHGKIVGPRIEVTHNGRLVRANRQLITLWQFEHCWRNQSPRSHAAFRKVYNRAGPVVAARIKSPWLADLAYLAIKPVELVARAVTAQR